MNSRRVAITGTTGYLGSALSSYLRDEGFDVVALNRRPSEDGGGEQFVRYSLGASLDSGALNGVDALVHAAWNLTNDDESDVYEENVLGSIRLFDDAQSAGVNRVIFVSSMSAYPGTRQVYGSMKLVVERDAIERGFAVVRPGLIYGPRARGMAGTLSRVARLPVWPTFAHSRLYTIAEDDVVRAMTALVSHFEVTKGSVVGLAHAEPITLIDALTAFAGRRHPSIPIPPRLVIASARVVSRAHIPLPFRPDALLGLTDQTPPPLNGQILRDLGVSPRPFLTTEST